jgi:tripartite-type tricarboxylate transporter receptor subunit TctC
MGIKKFTCVVSLLVLCCLLIVGCGNVQQPQQDAQPQQSQQTEEESDYPNRPINGIIAWGAGGATDVVSRMIGPLAEKELGNPIILSNMTGATGSIGTQFVYDQKADGYTLLFNAENPPLYPVLGISKLSYAEFLPIVITDEGYSVILVSNNSPYNSISDLIDAAKENPGKLNMGITGVGGQPYMGSLILKEVVGAEFNSVTYDGDGPVMTALLGGQLDVTIVSFGNAYQYIKNDDVRALCVMSNEVVEGAEDVPALGIEMPEFQEYVNVPAFFHGVFVKKGTHDLVIQKLSEAFKEAVNDPKFIKFCEENLYVPLGIIGEEAVDYIEKWQSQKAWLIHNAGDSVVSPESLGIPKP